MLTRVYVLYTGGTFGMMPDVQRAGHPLAPLSMDDVLPVLREDPSLSPDIDVVFDSLPDGRRIDSSSMTPQDWIAIAQRIHKNYHLFDGFVVIQGTDTLAYTSSALSFMFENLGKPIVITGAQLPLEYANTDARSNYSHAVMIAGYKASGLPLIPEVVVVFADKILRGCRARKVRTVALTAFESPNAPILGTIDQAIHVFPAQLRPAPEERQEVRVHLALETDVADVSLYPGMAPAYLKAILDLKSVKGVVLRTYGTGNAPDTPELLQVLAHGVRKDGKVIVSVTQCLEGSIQMGLYASSVGLCEAGVISGFDMTPEAALTKMMVVLGSRSGAEAQAQMLTDQRGEQSHSVI